MELDADTLFGQIFHQLLKVSKAAGKAIYGMHMQAVTHTKMTQAGF